MVVSTGILETKHPRQDELFVNIMEKAASLRGYPKICSHFWNPTFWVRGLGSFPHGLFRSLLCVGSSAFVDFSSMCP